MIAAAAMARTVLSRLGDAWQLRVRADTGAPDWIGPQALHWMAVQPRSARGGGWELVLGVRHGVPPRALPAQVAGLPVRCVPAQRARAQAAPRLTRTPEPRERGTATCLVRDRLNPDRYYVVGCGHVLAPDRRALWSDDAVLQHGALALNVSLREWQPAAADDGTPPADIDAALAQMAIGDLTELRRAAADWLPSGITDNTAVNREITLKRADGDVRGAVKMHWTGQVELPGSGSNAEYLLRDAIGYTSVEPTLPGDSGAAVWGSDDALLGMHIGELDPATAAGANALFGRIAPVLDWYQVKAFTRGDPATLDPGPPRAAGPGSLVQPPGPPLMPDGDETLVVAKTLWGEARGEPDAEAGMKAVANVIANRLARNYRGCDSAIEVCLDPQQFSCWNAGDPNRRLLLALKADGGDPQFALAQRVAALMLRGALPDATQGALHYVARSLRRRPDWLEGKLPCVVVGNHEFYNNVR